MHWRGQKSTESFGGKANHLEDLGLDGRRGSKGILGKLAGRIWSGFTWLRIGTGGGLLLI
jgi:hypothetical protein